jgi:hypothetical protein
MDIRNNHADLINQTKQALLPNSLLYNLLRKFDNILTVFSTTVDNKEYESIKEEILKKISEIVQGMYRYGSDKKTVIANFEEIQKTVQLFQKELDNFKVPTYIEKTQLQKILKQNIPLLDELINNSKLLFDYTGRIYQALCLIEELIKKNYFHSINYELAFMLLTEDINLYSERSQNKIKVLSDKYGGVPIVIKQNNNIYLFGNTDILNKLSWTITQLNSEKFDASLFSEADNTIKIRKYDEIKVVVYEEIKVKKAHFHSRLGKKIETYKLIIHTLHNDILNFKSAVLFYKANIATIQSHYRKTSKTLIDTDDVIVALKKQIEENEISINMTKSVLTQARTDLTNTFSIVKTLKQDLQNVPDYPPLIKQDVYSLKEVLKNIQPQLDIFDEGLGKTIIHVENIKAQFTKQDAQLNTLFKSFQLHSLHIIDQCTLSKCKENLINIMQASDKITSVGHEIDQLFKLSDTLRITVQANLNSTNQSLWLAREVSLKIIRFSEQANLLKQQLADHVSSSNSTGDHKRDTSEKNLVIHPRKQSMIKFAMIQSPGHSDESIFTSPIQKQGKSNNKSSPSNPINISQTQSHVVIYFLKDQIKNHPWQTGIGGEKAILIEDDASHSNLKKTVSKTVHLITPRHANKMLNVFNTLGKSKENNTGSNANYASAINEIDKIAIRALNKHSFFRSSSTEITYRRMKYDIDETKRLAQIQQPYDILSFTQNIIEKLPTHINLVEFGTRYKEISSQDIPYSDKLIQLYLTTRNYLYNNSLTNDEKKQLHAIIFSLSQVNAAASLKNIKNEIACKCRTNQWSVYLGGETITIDHINYKVPGHVKKIWDAIKLNLLDDGADTELVSFDNKPDTESNLMETLGEVMCISENAALNSHMTRHHHTQDFYMNIVTSKNFLQYHPESCSYSRGPCY